MSEKLPVSVTMIARNEAHRLPRSLGSVAGWVSEIIVIINDCTDDTAQVAASFGAVVIEHPYANMRDQKTVAVQKATQPWVLNLDADEVVSPELKAELFAFFRNPPADVEGVWIPRRLWFMNQWIRHGENYPDRVLRLFRNGKAWQSGTEAHDCFSVAGRTARFKKDILHYSHDSITAQINKINFFADAFVRRKHAAGKRFHAVETVFRSAWRFVRAYFLRLGFLDGFAGFYQAYFAAFTTFIRYSRLYELEKRSKD